ncbi:amine dehydrogenase large subunit [Sphingobium sp. B2]|uniref:amine dehydrogenase large subunit n=1 Tax=Sphingobium sp. B2 TaxID=2583228 RepID=UPI00119DEFA6|nr:amine dehydrogenase large subunit [Sphingobium sp. B2]
MRFWHVMLLTSLIAAPAAAQLEPETLNVAELDAQMKPHWIWVNDVSFNRPLDGRAYLVDADSGAFLGMVSGGYVQGPLQIAPDGQRFSMVSTYYSRGSTGERTDVVTFYDIKTLGRTGEVIIPPKQMKSLPLLAHSTRTDDDRFQIVTNFTPEQSITIVDVPAQKLVGETETPGCTLVYPVDARRFMMLCGDGSMQTATLSETGALTLGKASQPIFADSDPAHEKAVRLSTSEWLFQTSDTHAVVVDGSGAVPKVKKRWSMIGQDVAGWRTGGVQPIAYHAATKRLFTLMHEGDATTRQDPGVEIWVFDATTGKRLHRYPMAGPATAIAVSEDDQPLLYTAMFGVPKLIVYDAATGKQLREIDEMGSAITVLQPAPRIPGAK